MEVFTVKTEDIEMDCCTFGTGKRAFVIIPGLSLKSVMPVAGSVAHAYKCFNDDFTSYLFDRRKNIGADYSVREMAHDTATVMKELGIKDADIFGTSQGGMIAQWIAVDYPELVHSLVLGSTCARRNVHSLEIVGQWQSYAKEHNVKALNHCFFESIYSDAFREKHRAALQYLENDGTPEDCDRFLVFANACENFDIYDKLEKIKCPVFVIGAKEDKVLTGEASEEIAEKLGCEIYMYGDGYNHAVYDEAPDYKERILNFFKSI